MIKICSVVIGKTLEEFLDNLDMAQQVSNFVELRVDYINDFSINQIDTIKQHVYKENIFTCRSINGGGKFEGSEEELKNIVYKADELQFNHIDIEMSMLNSINFLNKNSKIIGSYHNFNNTPSYDELLNIYKNIKRYDFVDIVKIATNVVNDSDNIELVKLLINKRDNIIVLGMGEKGKITRIISPLLGGYLTFASINNNISASGQISLGDLIKIYGDKYDGK